MLYEFETPYGDTGCILCGTVRPGYRAGPVVTSSTNDNTGLTTDRFSVVVAHKNDGTEAKPIWRNIAETCVCYSKEFQPGRVKTHRMVSLLKAGEMVVILGRRVHRPFNRGGVTEDMPQTVVEAVLPVHMMYDVLFALYSKIARDEAPEKITTLKPAKPMTGRRTVFMDREDGALFE